MFFDNIIGEYIIGSTAYGINIRTEDYVSDEDRKAIAILPIRETLRLENLVETVIMHSDDFDGELLEAARLKEATDYEVHSLKKFMALAKNCNPTIIEMLFVEKRFITKNSKYVEILRENRHLFLSKRSIKTFGGYAMQQLVRIKHALYSQTPEGIEKQKELHMR